MASVKALRFDSTTGNITEVSPTADTLLVGAITMGAGPFNAGGFPITNVPAPVNATDGVNKGYVDGLSQGVSFKTPS